MTKATPELAPAPGLLLVLSFGLGGPGYGLAVGDLWGGGIDTHAELAGYPGQGDLEVRVAETGEQRLSRLRSAFHLEGGVLLQYPL